MNCTPAASCTKEASHSATLHTTHGKANSPPRETGQFANRVLQITPGQQATAGKCPGPASVPA